jgi:hypothetical protein
MVWDAAKTRKRPAAARLGRALMCILNVSTVGSVTLAVPFLGPPGG